MFSRKRYVLLAVLVVGLVIFAFSGASLLTPAIVRLFVDVAAQNRIGLRIEEPSVGLGFSAARVQVWSKKLPTVNLSNVRLTPTLTQLLKGQAGTAFSGELLSGQFIGKLSVASSKIVRGDFKVEKAILAEHQFFSNLPVEGGFTDLALESFEIDKGRFQGIGSISFSQFKLLELVSLPPYITRLPVALDIPAFTISKAFASFSIDAKRNDFQDISISTSLFTLRGRGSVGNDGVKPFDGQFCLKLSPEGVARLGSLLPLIGGQSNTEPQQLNIAGSALRSSGLRMTVVPGCT